MAEQGEKITDEDLSRAVFWCFDNDVKISPEIFEALISHGADARKTPWIFSYNRFCNNLGVVKVLLEAGANPLPEKDVFPLACLPQKPDLKFKDKNGYTLQILLKDIIEGRVIMGEAVNDLIEFRKKIE